MSYMYAAGNLYGHRSAVTSLIAPRDESQSKDFNIKLVSGSRDNTVIVWGDDDIIDHDTIEDDDDDDDESIAVSTATTTSKKKKKLSKRAKRRLEEAKQGTGSVTSGQSINTATSNCSTTSASAPLAAPVRRLEGHSGFVSDLDILFVKIREEKEKNEIDNNTETATASNNDDKEKQAKAKNDKRTSLVETTAPLILSSSWDKSLRVWHALTGECLCRCVGGGSNNTNLGPLHLGGHTKDVLSCAFAEKRNLNFPSTSPTTVTTSSSASSSSSSNNHFLFALSASRDNTIRLWNITCVLEKLYASAAGDDERNDDKFFTTSSPKNIIIGKNKNSKLAATSIITPSTANAASCNFGTCIRVFEGHRDWVSCAKLFASCFLPGVAADPSSIQLSTPHVIAFCSTSWDGTFNKWAHYLTKSDCELSLTGNNNNNNNCNDNEAIDAPTSSNTQNINNINSNNMSSKNPLVFRDTERFKKLCLTCAAPSPDGSLVAVASKAGTIALYDMHLTDAQSEATFLYDIKPAFPTAYNNTGSSGASYPAVSFVCYAPTRFWMVFVCECGVKVLDLETKQYIAECSSPNDMQYVKTPPIPTSCMFSYDSEVLYVGYTDNVIRTFCFTSLLQN